MTFVDINKISRYGGLYGLEARTNRENPRASGLLNVVARGML
ncbi:hypothetical protein RLC89_01905 [Streptococcus pneumoniae]|nr:hypothetical protein [Streptococcus pneumoniae]MDS2575145.1 hypothetical protein [Streptococcus pneumoniae]MDS2653666.1 hypothetical protein [Streptococcus pneumoniae]MDS2763865.1 hypothetical protein [Streptococcus pneumoniae]MDS3356536.1 hypothetical protein [Streptococcus pneumoniae]